MHVLSISRFSDRDERGRMLVPVMVLKCLTAASNLDNCFLNCFCSVSLLSSVILRRVTSLLPSTRVPLIVWLIVWVSCIFFLAKPMICVLFVARSLYIVHTYLVVYRGHLLWLCLEHSPSCISWILLFLYIVNVYLVVYREPWWCQSVWESWKKRRNVRVSYPWLYTVRLHWRPLVPEIRQKQSTRNAIETMISIWGKVLRSWIVQETFSISLDCLEKFLLCLKNVSVHVDCQYKSYIKIWKINWEKSIISILRGVDGKKPKSSWCLSKFSENMWIICHKV